MKPARLRFTHEEDLIIMKLVSKHGAREWKIFETYLPGRTGRQIRERYINYLSPDTKRSGWTDEEDDLLRKKVREHGRKWSTIATFFSGRTDVTLKNRWLKLQRRDRLKEVAAPSEPIPMPKITTEQPDVAQSEFIDTKCEVQYTSDVDAEILADILEY